MILNLVNLSMHKLELTFFCEIHVKILIFKSLFDLYINSSLIIRTLW